MSLCTPPPKVAQVVDERAAWKKVAIPSEHGGWGLTAEPILLGLLLAFSWAGVAIGVSALLAFVARTPLKVALVDRRRGRDLDRTALARRIAAVEVAAIAVVGLAAIVLAGTAWLIPVAVALPLFGVELWFDVRSRGRRLVPEMCGAVGMGVIAAAIIVAADGSVRLAVASWLVLAARAIAAIPFARTQVERLHGRTADTRASDLAQLIALAIAATAVFVQFEIIAGSAAVAVVVALQLMWVRQERIAAATVLGIRQMVMGFAVVAATALGVHLL